MASCPRRQELVAFVTGKIDRTTIERLAGHLEACLECQAGLYRLDADADPLVRRLRGLRDLQREPVDPHAADLLKRARSLVPPTAGPAANPATVAQHVRVAGPDLPPQLDQYRILRKIGQGGMGAVYQAQHALLGNVVALKVLSPERVGKSHALPRFLREIAAIGRLDHPYIVRATDAREAGGLHFLVMEYVEGINLEQLVRSRDPLPIADACELVRQAAVALQHIHEHGLVHRDIKPSNLMLTKGAKERRSDPAPHVKLLDLGLARLREAASGADLTGPGEVMGTFNYLAPEQATDAAGVDIRADIYSLGCTLYHLLAGRPPFESPEHASPARKLGAHLYESPPSLRSRRPAVPEALAAVVATMLAKDRSQRYARPADVAEALRAFTAGCDLAALAMPYTEPTTTESDTPVAADMLAAPLHSPSGKTTDPQAASAGTPSDSPGLVETVPRQPGSRRPGARLEVRIGPVPGCRARLVLLVAVNCGVGLLVAGWITVHQLGREAHTTFQMKQAGARVPPSGLGTNVEGLPSPKGFIDVMVWDKKAVSGGHDPERFRRHLNQAGVLPLRADDRVRVEIQLNRPMYVYVVWISSRGEALPVYPWQKWKWDHRPADEQPVRQLALPAADGTFVMEGPEDSPAVAPCLVGLLGSPLSAGPWPAAAALIGGVGSQAGMETLMLLARESPLPRDVNLAALFAGLPPPRHTPDDAAVWFENGRIVTDEPSRAPKRIAAQRADDPVLVVQALLRDKLKEYFIYTRAVSFSFTSR